MAGCRKLHQLARDDALGVVGHRRIGMRPVADDAEALEFLALHVEPVACELPALVAERIDRDRIEEVRLLLALGAILLLDLPFDRQAVAVPARHVVRIVSEHLLRLDDEILQDLVQRVPDVDVAVGVGRPVVQREFHAAFRLGSQFLVEPDFVPALQQFRLEFRQSGAHRKLRLRQEKRLAPVAATGGGRMRSLGDARLGRSLRVFRHQVIFRPQILGRSSNCPVG